MNNAIIMKEKNMKIKLEIEEDVVNMWIGLMKYVDPTGFMFGKLIAQINSVVEEAYKKEEVVLKEKKDADLH